MTKFTKKILDRFQHRSNVSKIINEDTGEVSYITSAIKLTEKMKMLDSDSWAIDQEHHVIALFTEEGVRTDTIYICKSLQGEKENLDFFSKNIRDLEYFESWNENSQDWVPCLVLKKDTLAKDRKKAF